MKYVIPNDVTRTTQALRDAGFEAYLVGGCVRDMLMGRTPNDWDITTNANPEEIQELFPKTFYENDYGTVGVVWEKSTDTAVGVIEITPYRLESGYSDKRHPDSVRFSEHVEDDLKRRDFTINAIAYNEAEDRFVDPHNGQQDIKDMVIRTVGNPLKRFDEDTLRILRAIRFSAQLGFTISRETFSAITQVSEHLKTVSKERIRDEFTKLMRSERPMAGLKLLRETEMIGSIVPDLEKSFHVEQNQAHSYGVWEHLLRTVQAAADKGFSLEVRLAALFHDIAKPHTKAFDTKKKDWSFHGHEVVGARIARKTLKELRFSRETIEKVGKLVRWHMFFSDTEQITHSAVRRMIRNVGPENVKELMNLRVCDRIGTGRPKEKPYRFRKYQAMIDEVLRDPISVGMLKIDGETLMKVSREKPGPRIGWVLHALLEEVLDDPKKNTTDYLEKRALELLKLSDDKLKVLGEAGKEKKEHEEHEEVQKIRKKHWVE